LQHRYIARLPSPLHDGAECAIAFVLPGKKEVSKSLGYLMLLLIMQCNAFYVAARTTIACTLLLQSWSAAS